MKGCLGLALRPIAGTLEASSKGLRGVGLLFLGKRGIQAGGGMPEGGESVLPARQAWNDVCCGHAPQQPTAGSRPAPLPRNARTHTHTHTWAGAPAPLPPPFLQGKLVRRVRAPGYSAASEVEGDLAASSGLGRGAPTLAQVRRGVSLGSVHAPGAPCLQHAPPSPPPYFHTNTSPS